MDSLILSARQAYETKKYQEAADLYETMVKQDPLNGMLHQGLGQCLYQLGQNDDALMEARQAIQLDPGLSKAHTTLGLVYLRLQNYDESQAEFQKALELDPNNADLYVGIAGIAYIKRNFQECITALLKAIELNPNNFQAHYNLANAYQATKAHKKAIREIRTAYKLKPSIRVGIKVILEQEYFYRYWIALLLFVIIGLGPLVARLVYILPLMIVCALYDGMISIYFFQQKNYRAGIKRLEILLATIVSFICWYIYKGL